MISSWAPWFTPIILATQEIEISWIVVRTQPWQAVHKNLCQKNQNKPITEGLVEWLKCRLSSNLSTEGKKKKLPKTCESKDEETVVCHKNILLQG
jgi:hypothetical protein